jgi:hypothetical protein
MLHIGSDKNNKTKKNFSATQQHRVAAAAVTAKNVETESI